MANPKKTEDPGVILSRTMFIDNSDPDNIRILPWHQVDHATLGLLWEARDQPKSGGAQKPPFKKVTRIQFANAEQLYNQRFKHDGTAGAGMVGGPGASTPGVLV